MSTISTTDKKKLLKLYDVWRGEDDDGRPTTVSRAESRRALHYWHQIEQEVGRKIPPEEIEGWKNAEDQEGTDTSTG
jgi:hypothetical protein